MSAVVNLRFDPPVGFQTSGGPGWKSEIVSLASGAEVRNALWSGPLRRWHLAGVVLTAEALQSLTHFFNARRGAHQGFRFRDPFGFQTGAPGSEITPFDQAIATGDGVTRAFQLVIHDGADVPRPITRPVASTMRVAIAGTETDGFTLDDATGLLTFETAPGHGAAITAGFAYDTPVRFEQDRLELARPGPGTFQLVQLGLVEIREVAI